MKKYILLISFLNFLFVTTSFGANKNFSDNDLPVKINADDMVYDIDKNKVTFSGNVVVIRGEFNMKAPKMTIFLQSGENNKQINVKEENIPLTGKVVKTTKKINTQNKIDKIEAYNGVKFDFETQSGHSETAIYDARKGILTMKGNPVVKDGNNSIRGNTILYYLYERRSEVVGSNKKRVEAIFDPKK